MSKFVLHIKEVDEFPQNPPRLVPNYAFVESPSLRVLGEDLSRQLGADVMTDEWVLLAESTPAPTSGGDA